MGDVYHTKEAEKVELYFVAHPGSPSAERRPRVFFRNNVWVALLGRSIEEGIVGFGSTVAAALAAFDAQYEGDLRPSLARHNSGLARIVDVRKGFSYVKKNRARADNCVRPLVSSAVWRFAEIGDFM